jgi:hypothetical protein
MSKGFTNKQIDFSSPKIGNLKQSGEQGTNAVCTPRMKTVSRDCLHPFFVHNPFKPIIQIVIFFQFVLK